MYGPLDCSWPICSCLCEQRLRAFFVVQIDDLSFTLSEDEIENVRLVP